MNRSVRKLSLLALLALTLAFIPGTRPSAASSGICCSDCEATYEACCQSNPDACSTTCDSALERCARTCNTGC